MSFRLILASSSPYRQQLLKKLGLPFSCISPDIDERPLVNERSQTLAQRLSIEKARAVADQAGEVLIIGSDQVCCLDGQPLGKPGNPQNAIAQLQRLSGRAVTFYTGLCLINNHTGTCQSCVEPFTVHFKKLSLEQIQAYVEKDRPWDCAGSFKAEGLGIALFERLEGEDPNALTGLPLIRLIQLLKNEGIDVFTAC